MKKRLVKNKPNTIIPAPAMLFLVGLLRSNNIKIGTTNIVSADKKLAFEAGSSITPCFSARRFTVKINAKMNERLSVLSLISRNLRQKTATNITAEIPVVKVKYANDEKSGGRLLMNTYDDAQHSVIENNKILFSVLVIRQNLSRCKRHSTRNFFQAKSNFGSMPPEPHP